ncbi:MAG: phage major capsid protein, partial [Alphaproteobacteria bacterium]|nr:phage major capsid protein [Alphaproteobacteria bacterium]
MDLETKASYADAEIKSAFDEFLSAFEAFKQSNDERLKQIETRSADVVTDDKVERINQALSEQKRALDELTLAAHRPALGETRPAPDRLTREKKAAFDRYVRKGDAGGYDALEVKALSVGSDADGGYVVPPEIEQSIDRLLAKASPIRSLATVRQIGSNVYRKPFATTEAASGWVAETAAPAQTATPTLAALDFPAMELYAMPAATQTLLDDAQVNIEQWLAEEVQIVFAEQEGAAFISGDGTNKPKGFLAYTAVADSAWSWGNLGYIASGAAGGFAASDPADALLDLAYAPRQAYRANGTWVMNRKTESAVRKFKDSTGAYIWQPGGAAGQPATLFGYPVA